MTYDENDLAIAHREFYQEKASRTLRFGQYVCNRFNLTWPELFYCEDTQQAYSMALSQIPKSQVNSNK